MHELGSAKDISRFTSKINVTVYVFETSIERMKGVTLLPVINKEIRWP